MQRRPSSPKADIRLSSAMEGAPGVPESDTPLRLLLLGDFGSSSAGPHGTRTLHPVDRDSFEDLFRSLRVTVRLAPEEGRVETLDLRSLDDLHPDRLVERLECFAEMRSLRERLDDPRTFAEAAAVVRPWIGPPSAQPPPAPSPPSPSDADGDDVVRDLLTGAARRKTPGAGSSFEAEVKALVGPLVVPGEDPELPRLRAALDARSGDLLRGVLRQPRLRALEAAWRGLDLLLRRVDDEVRISVLDLPREALAEDLRTAEQLSRTGLHRHLVTDAVETPGVGPWGAIVGLYDFGPTLADAALLSRLAKLARAAGAPFLAAAREGIVGCASLVTKPDPAEWRTVEGDGAEVWEALRTLPEAEWICLALPRLMLRLPYGARTDPIESFPFEEIPGRPAPDDYLWGNPALASALALAGAFAVDRWRLRPETALEIDRLPLHVWQDGEETHVTPPSEVVLTLRAAERLLEAGLVPVLSLRGQDVVRVAGLRSIASPHRLLAGRWAG